MEYDFQIDPELLRIPNTAYKAVKRCSYCQSVFLTNNNCESCGRALHYHLIGEPFGAKSFYGIKERYINSFTTLHKLFPIFENKKSPLAKSYVRKLEKRFSDLISAFNSDGVIADNQRKLFYVESIQLINELYQYDINPELLITLIVENDSSLIGQELLIYLQTTNASSLDEKTWFNQLLNYQFWGVLRFEYMIKVFLVTATVVLMAVHFKEIISSQFGK